MSSDGENVVIVPSSCRSCGALTLQLSPIFTTGPSIERAFSRNRKCRLLYFNSSDWAPNWPCVGSPPRRLHGTAISAIIVLSQGRDRPRFEQVWPRRK
jgi:hypothetical protein